MEYGLDPCMVKRIGGHVITSYPCIGDIKDLQTLFALSFAFKFFTGLRAALCNFNSHHERLFLCLLAPRILFDIAVVSRTPSLIANLLGCEPYHVSVYWFLCLALGSSIAQSYSPRGLSRLVTPWLALSLETPMCTL